MTPADSLFKSLYSNKWSLGCYAIKNVSLNVRLAGGHLYGKQLFTWLSVVVSLMASFCAVFFPLDVLDEIWDVTESVSGGFLTYSYTNITSTSIGLILL